MAKIPSSSIAAYTGGVNGAIGSAQGALHSAFSSIDASMGVDDVRDVVLAVMDALCTAATDASAGVAAAYYDAARQQQVGSAYGAKADSQRDPKATDKAVRYFVSLYEEDGDLEALERNCSERIDFECKRAAGRSIMSNGIADPSGARWARVPTGDETCDFCIMLASRGPVYLTAASAGADFPDHFHANCDCRIVPMWGTYQVETDAGGYIRRGGWPIDGYDPDAYFEQYLESHIIDRVREARRKGQGSYGGGTSHPMTWAKAYRQGLVSMSSVKEVKEYISAAADYEDLIDRIRTVEGELPYYGLSDRYISDIQTTCWNVRQRVTQDQ